MTGRDGQRADRMCHAAAPVLAALTVVGAGVAYAQTIDPAAEKTYPGGTVSTTVSDIGCPDAAQLPDQVTLDRDPECAEGVTDYRLVFVVGAEAEPGEHHIEILDCSVSPCVSSGQTFTLSIQAAATATPTPTATSSPDGDGEHDPPPTPKEAFLDELLKQLKKEVAEDAEALLDGVDDLREGEERTLTLELHVPDALVDQLRGDQASDDGEGYHLSYFVRADLAGEGFEIRLASDLKQGARNGTWDWRVRPTGSGSRELALTITMSLNGGGGVVRVREVFETGSYDVAPNWPFKIKRFFKGSWRWLIGTLLTLYLAYLTMRKKKHPAPPEEPAAPRTD